MKLHRLIFLILFTLPSFAETLEPIATLTDFDIWSVSEGQALVLQQYDDERYLHNAFLYAVNGEGEWQLYETGISNLRYTDAILFKTVLYVAFRDSDTTPPNFYAYDVSDPAAPRLIQVIEKFYGSPRYFKLTDDWLVTYAFGDTQLYLRSEDGSISLHSIFQDLFPDWMNDDYIVSLKNSVVGDSPVSFEVHQYLDNEFQFVRTIDLELPHNSDPLCSYVIEPLVFLDDMFVFSSGLSCIDEEPSVDQPASLLQSTSWDPSVYQFGFAYRPFSDFPIVEYGRIDDEQEEFIYHMVANQSLLAAVTGFRQIKIYSVYNKQFIKAAEIASAGTLFMDETYLYLLIRKWIAETSSHDLTIEIYQLPEVPTSHSPAFDDYK